MAARTRKRALGPRRDWGEEIGWGRVARFYDWQLPLEGDAIAAALDLATALEDDRLLDLGTGTGGVLRALLKRSPRPREVIGIDSSPAMLARVPRLPPGWELRAGDATRLPVPAAHFDLLTAGYLLHLLDASSLDRVLAEMSRVLKPTGRLVTVTPIAPRSRLRRPYELLIAGLIGLTGSSMGLRPFDPRPDLARAGLTPQQGRYVPGIYPSLCVLARPALAD